MPLYVFSPSGLKHKSVFGWLIIQDCKNINATFLFLYLNSLLYTLTLPTVSLHICT